MTVRPILFSGPMVQALLAGNKTQTRRIVRTPARYAQVEFVGGGGRESPDWNDPACWGYADGNGSYITLAGEGRNRLVPCPYGQPGNLLWVRETHAIGEPDGYAVDDRFVAYRASDPNLRDPDGWAKTHGLHWRPSIHMPGWASRLTLELTGVRVERLQAISEMDAYAEGIDTEGSAYLAAEHGKLGGASGPAPSVCAYADLWDSINGPGSWDANPWVWALEFRVHHCNVDAFLKRRAV
jgi:hypothetical protein